VTVVVDSSVWIDFLNGRNAPHVQQLRLLLGTDDIIVGDLMLCEVLQGLESERAARAVEALRTVMPRLRRRGITVRKTIDLLIGTWCIQHGRPLLHNDGDFHPMAWHLGLIEVPV
jgi:predicted nucleic acid-binding protein